MPTWRIGQINTTRTNYSMAENQGKTHQLDIQAQIEALLFVAPEGATVSQMATALGRTPRVIENALEALEADYSTRGIRLQRHGAEIRMTSAPEAAELIEILLELDATTRLSKAGLETLGIIAYEQPVTRPQIEAIRGVNSDGVVRTLISRELISEAGRAEGPGRPILYITTAEFLNHFGLASLKSLPSLEDELVDENNNNGENEPEMLKD